jgi:glycosyltransferase involved in cell wall biosynthesis
VRRDAAPSRRVRVLHVITGLGVGGAESMLVSLLTTHNAELDQSVVSLMPDGFHATRLRDQGIAVDELDLHRPSRAAADILRLARIIRVKRPDVVQGWMYHGNLAALLSLSLSGRRDATRLAWGIRCSDRTASAESLTLRAVIRLGAPFTRFSDVLVANSQVGLDYHVQHGYRTRRTLVIHNGIDTTRYRPDPAAREAMRHELGFSPGDVVLVHVARVHPMKDHGTFLEALRGLRALPRVRALAIGVGTEALPDLPNLTRLGRRSDVPALLTAADVIVSSSAYGEGFSNAVAEGMAAGLVPVATAVGDSQVIVGDTGTVIPIRSARALGDAAADLAALGPAMLRRRGQEARDRIVARFSLERAIGQFTNLYADLAGHIPDGAA